MVDKELRRFQSVAAGGFPDSWALLEPAELLLTHRQTSFNVAQLHTGNIKITIYNSHRHTDSTDTDAQLELWEIWLTDTSKVHILHSCLEK